MHATGRTVHPNEQSRQRPSPSFPLRRVSRALWAAALVFGVVTSTHAAGTLKPVNSALQAIQIQDHHLGVVINNGFAITTVNQTFFNPNAQDLEALYSFPVPKSASLSEVTIMLGEKTIHGEVLPKGKARKVYEEERDKGNESGLAEKKGYQQFEFAVSPVKARSTAVIQFVYYQPLDIDTGVGRYVYPLEEGGTDDPAAQSFWTRNDQVEQSLTAEIELKSAWPVADVRLPGLENSAAIEKIGEGHYRARLEQKSARLNRDLVFYYRLADNLPGRVEVIPYRADPGKPGTFMMVVTPGIDLQPLDRGADYVFVLDLSGSMSGKLHTLADGVSRTLGELKPQDRFRIITFANSAQSLCGGWTAANPEDVAGAITKVKGLQVAGGTNMHAGLRMALNDLDDDRATSIVLVTDAVTNTGVVAPKAFHKLMSQHDVRVFGFLMGNSANWPLMRTVCSASGGFYAGVSNSDDIIGQIMLAKSKVTFECLHDADLRITGVKTHGTNDGAIGKVYRGQQLVIMGRYNKPGTATVTLKARLTGEDKTYTTTFDFPKINKDNPELERLWAMTRIEHLEHQRDVGLMEDKEVRSAVQGLGVDYQLVTDETSMLVSADDAFARHGVERRNRQRLAVEHQAQAARRTAPITNYRVDRKKPAFSVPTPSIGGGALGPVGGLSMVGMGVVMLVGMLSRKEDREAS